MHDPLSAPDDLAIGIIADLLHAQTGQSIGADRRWRIGPALAPLLRARGLTGLDALIVELTRSDDDTLAREIVEALLNNETYFFRDLQVFDYLAQSLLPQLADELATKRSLRIWCAGCSTGQEPLSIAMLLDEQAARWADWDVSILATDISHKAIATARAGIYSSFQVQRGLGVQQMLRHFDETQAGWQVHRSLAGKVRFQTHNVLDAMPGERPFDLVVCRNVLLYFDQPARRRAYERLGEAMADHGRLILGGGELILGSDSPFVPCETRHGIFRPARSVASPAREGKFGLYEIERMRG